MIMANHTIALHTIFKKIQNSAKHEIAKKYKIVISQCLYETEYTVTTNFNAYTVLLHNRTVM